MRTILITAATLTASLALTACASAGPNTAPPPADFDVSATTFEGWAQVANGEIRLFEQQRDLPRLPQRCISAVLPRNLQRTAGDLSTLKIRLYGRAMAWSERNGAQTHQWEGSTVVNECRRNVVILADRVEALR